MDSPITPHGILLEQQKEIERLRIHNGRLQKAVTNAFELSRMRRWPLVQGTLEKAMELVPSDSNTPNSEARGDASGHVKAQQGHTQQGRGGPDIDDQAAPGSTEAG